MTVKFTVNYFQQREGQPRTFSHSYDETWEKTNYHCPCCGNTEVWHDTSGGDYYVGEEHLCLACKACFYLPHTPAPSTDEYDEQRYQALWKHIRGD